ncbi:MAG: hypothetical protein ACK59C_06835 [Holosporales bacterium]|jgi:hypothetical protein
MKFIGFFVFSFLLVLFVGGFSFDPLTIVLFSSALALFMLSFNLKDADKDKISFAQIESALLLGEGLALLIPFWGLKVFVSVVIIGLALWIVRTMS